jgi:putative acetyltransferase
MTNLRYYCDILLPNEYDILLDIWEASVRATHLFLKEEDIIFFKKTIIENNLFLQSDITVARNEQSALIGFIGCSGSSLDMIFILPEWIGKGVGKMLMNFAIEEKKVTQVEVNEQNTPALEFYKHFGFKVVKRSELDDTRLPYPVLYMVR